MSKRVDDMTPEQHAAKLERERERYATNPEKRAAKLERQRERYVTDPEYRAAKIERQRERRAAKRAAAAEKDLAPRPTPG